MTPVTRTKDHCYTSSVELRPEALSFIFVSHQILKISTQSSFRSVTWNEVTGRLNVRICDKTTLFLSLLERRDQDGCCSLVGRSKMHELSWSLLTSLSEPKHLWKEDFCSRALSLKTKGIIINNTWFQDFDDSTTFTYFWFMCHASWVQSTAIGKISETR